MMAPETTGGLGIFFAIVRQIYELNMRVQNESTNICLSVVFEEEEFLGYKGAWWRTARQRHCIAGSGDGAIRSGRRTW